MRLGSFDFRPGWLPSLVALALLALLSSLGSWQLGRANEKLALTQAAQQRSAEPGVDLGRVDVTQALPPTFSPVQADGYYDSDRQFLLDNRTHAGRAGFHVLTPFRMGTGYAVLVNRGWVPLGARRDELPAIAVDVIPRRLIGELRAPREDQLVLGDTGLGGEAATWPRIVQRVEIAPMSEALGYSLLPALVALDPDAPQGFVRQWGAYIGIPPERHHGYALQWFSLAAALVVIYVVVNTRRIRPAASGEVTGPSQRSQ